MTVTSASNDKIKFLPCLESDYQDALNDNLPVRWLKASKEFKFLVNIFLHQGLPYNQYQQL